MKSIKVVTCITGSLFIAKQYFIEWINHSLFNCSPTEGYLGSLSFLGIMNIAVTNVCVQVLLECKFSFFFDKCSRVLACMLSAYKGLKETIFQNG